MAGAGYKLFASGDVLTADQVKTYLQQQTIMVFASDGDRDTALNSVKSEGMFVYITGDNTLQYYDGSSWNDTSLTADITGVTAGTNLSGGGSSGAVTLNLAIDSAVAFADQTASAVVIKDYAETDQALTSATTLAIDLANGNTGHVTLAHNVTDVDFTNVPTNGLATFTCVFTQDGTGSRTLAINAISVNAGGHVTGKTAGGSGLTLSTGANDVDIVTFLFVDAGTPYINGLLDFS